MPLGAVAAVLLLAALGPPSCHARLDAARTPPLGWRSWNAFLDNIDDARIMGQVRAMAGGPLLSVGYGRVGIDGGWVCQNDPTRASACVCGGVNGSYHDAQGRPVVGLRRFPNLTALAARAHALGVKLDFYGNSCNCARAEQQAWPDPRGTKGRPGPNGGNVHADVAALHGYGMDGIKVDGCSSAHNISRWASALAALEGPPLLLENCGDNGLRWSAPSVAAVSRASGECGFQMYRVSPDIAPQFYSAMFNLQAMVPYSNASRPGCWAYPDMLQCGSALLSADEARTHFSAWAVSSAPLILGYDLTSAPAHARAVAAGVINAGALAVSQAWHGHAGQPVWSSAERFSARVNHGAPNLPGRNASFPASQVWAKPLNHTCWAVLLINLLPHTSQDLSIALAALGPAAAAAPSVTVSSVWDGRLLATVRGGGSFVARGVAAHASSFVHVSLKTGDL